MSKELEFEVALYVLREHLRSMTDAERLAVFDRVDEGYCRACGCLTGRRCCQCENDE